MGRRFGHHGIYGVAAPGEATAHGNGAQAIAVLLLRRMVGSWHEAAHLGWSDVRRTYGVLVVDSHFGPLMRSRLSCSLILIFVA